ncbi:caspase family protein [Streptomyces sp. B6B3]|uniref:caspase, EACC1-associated type n=1 Tax=Streptomyces sp. B6B3 TaxID=3153570 RepID=UPI00325D859B
MVLPDPDRSRAVLIGVSKYRHFGSLPAVHNNVTALNGMLTSSLSWTLPQKHCTVVRDPRTIPDVVAPVAKAAQETTDTLLVYFAGHGFTDPDDGTLCLTLVDSRAGESYTTVPYNELRKQIRHAGTRARRRIVVLDCCYAASAFPRMADPRTGLADLAAVEGTYVIAAAGATQEALAEDGEGHTAFTGALLRLLRQGIAGGSEFLSLDTVFVHLHAEMLGTSRPLPRRMVRDSPGDLALARNPAVSPRAAAERPNQMTEDPQPERPVVPPAAGRTSFHRVAPPTPRGSVRRSRFPSARSIPRVRPARGHSRGRDTTRFARFLVAGLSMLGLLALGPATPAPNPFGGAERRVLFTDDENNADSVKFSPDGTRMAVLDVDGSTDLWDRPGRPRTVALSGTIQLWDPVTGARVGGPIRTDHALDVMFSADGTALLSRDDMEDMLQTWNTTSGERIGNPIITDATPQGLSRDGTKLTTSNVDEAGGTLQLWDTASGEQIGEVSIGPDASWVVGPDTIVAVRYPNSLELWDLATGTPVGDPIDTQHALELEFSQDNSLVAVEYPNSLELWDLANGEQADFPNDSYVPRLVLIQDGTALATLDDDARLQLWDLDTGGPVGYPVDTDAPAVAFSPNNATLATLDDDARCQLWDLDTGEQIGDSVETGDVVFTQDGTMLAASARTDGTVELWQWPPG